MDHLKKPLSCSKNNIDNDLHLLVSVGIWHKLPYFEEMACNNNEKMCLLWSFIRISTENWLNVNNSAIKKLFLLEFVMQVFKNKFAHT